MTDRSKGTPKRGFMTRAIRAATRPPEVSQRPNAVPIYQTVTYSSDDADELGAILTGERDGYAYARIHNPTSAAVAEAIAELEGAEAGFAFSSGMAAIHAALLSIVRNGDRILCTTAVYGSTRSLMVNVLSRLGIETDFVDPTDLPAVEDALTAKRSRILYLETISNPTIVVADIAALSAIAHRHGALVVVDNTFASPYVCRPLELGADLVVHSATKYMSGHSDVLAGAVVGSRGRIKAVSAVQTDTGGTLAPFSAFLVLRGITTLGIRMERHAATASVLAVWLERQDGVARVYHPSLPSHPQREVAARELRNGGGMLAFELEGGAPAGRAFMDALSIPELTASLGSIHTIVVHPPASTHRQLSEAELREAGIAPGLLRCSVGLEDAEDLQADFAQALEAARAASSSTPASRNGRTRAVPSGSAST